MFVVDTNILVYAADQDSEEHSWCRDFLLKCREENTPWYLSWGIVYEFLRVTTHSKVLNRPFKSKEAWAFIQSILASPSLSMLSASPRHSAVLNEILEELKNIRGNSFFDVQIAALMKEHGLKTIYTRDADFHRFKFLKVVDPLP